MNLLEAISKGRVKAHTRTVGGKTVQVREYTTKRTKKPKRRTGKRARAKQQTRSELRAEAKRLRAVADEAREVWWDLKGAQATARNILSTLKGVARHEVSRETLRHEHETTADIANQTQRISSSSPALWSKKNLLPEEQEYARLRKEAVAETRAFLSHMRQGLYHMQDPGRSGIHISDYIKAGQESLESSAKALDALRDIEKRAWARLDKLGQQVAALGGKPLPD